ncbi:MAG: PKD domain-containing protein [Nocardioidaceae bacterium]
MSPLTALPSRATGRLARLLPLAVVAAALPSLLAPASADAATGSFYVDKTMTTCSDSGPGSATAPYCTLSKGVAALSAGATLYVGSGSYAETLKPSVSGTATAPVTITGWPGRSPIIGAGMTYGVMVSSRSYVTVSGLTVVNTLSDGIYVSGSSHVTIAGNTVKGAGKPSSGQTAPGISLRSTSASTVSGNTSDQNHGHGILLTSGSTGNTVSGNEASLNAEGWERNANGIDVIAPGNTIIGNVTHDNEDSGINFYTGGNNNLAAGNVTYNNGDHGIDDYNVTGGRLIGNTVFHNCTSGINVEGTSGSYTVENNVAVDNAVYAAYNGIACSRRKGNIGIWDSAPASTTVDHNLVWLTKAGTMYVFKSSYSSLAAMQAATGQERYGVQGDPRFVDVAGGNLQLSAGSPAIDRANSGVSGAQSVDLLGRPRVDDPSTPNTYAQGPRLYDDIGAYEFQPGSVPPPAPAPPTAALTVSPTSGTAPLAVTANASGSTDPQGQTLSYAFDFGDGTTVGPQAGATATHTYATAGTFTVKVTVTDTSGLSASATRTVTVATPTGPSAPTAALTVSPTSGTAPLAVTANASASTDPQGQTLTYAFDFGDGTTVGPQAGATATHTYATSGTFTVKVTVTDTSGLSGSATTSVTVSTSAPAAAPSYVSQIATNYSTSSKTSGSITVWRTAGVQAGDLVVLYLQLTGTAATGTVTGTDTAGNTYTAAHSVADAAGHRLVVLTGVAGKALAPNDRIDVAFPTATGGYRLLGDEFAGARTVDVTAGATGTTSAFSSGATAATSAAQEVVVGAVMSAGASAAPTWASPWKALGAYAVSSTYLGRAYQLPSTTGTFAASGTTSGTWRAATVTRRP